MLFAKRRAQVKVKVRAVGNAKGRPVPTQVFNMGSIKTRIAVVDDDYSVVRSLARTLRSAGYDVATFGSAKDFLASLTVSVPQCLVLDVHMPEMSGLELQDRLAAQRSSVPIVLMTAHDSPQTRERAHRAGSSGPLLKPFGNELLLRSIQEALDRQSPADLQAVT